MQYGEIDNQSKSGDLAGIQRNAPAFPHPPPHS